MKTLNLFGKLASMTRYSADIGALINQQELPLQLALMNKDSQKIKELVGLSKCLYSPSEVVRA